MKPSSASHGNVKLSAGVQSKKQSLKTSQRPAVNHQNAAASKPASHPESVTSNRPVLSSKSASHSMPAPARKSSSLSQGRVSNQRRSVSSQFVKSAADRRQTVHLPAAAGRPQSTCDRRKSYQAQLMSRQKATHQASNPPSSRERTKSNQTQTNAKKRDTASQIQSCRDRRKSYQVELLLRQKAAVAASKKPAPCNSNAVMAENSKLLEASASKPADGPRISTPHTCRRSTTTATPSLSCIPRRKTVTFLTPASHKTTPQLHRNQPVRKEMSMR